MFVCIILTGCSEDFEKYDRQEFEISSNLTGNIYVVDEVCDELNSIVDEYSKNLTLTYVEYLFSDECQGDVMFHYKRDYIDKRGKEFLETLDLYVNANGQANKVVYTDGRINRVNDYPSNNILNKKANILDVIEEYGEPFINDNDNSYVKVVLDENGIAIKYYVDNSIVDEKFIMS